MKIKNKKKIVTCACIGALAAMPFMLCNSPVQRSVIDLTDTEWVFNDDISLPSLEQEGKARFDIDFVSGSISYERLTVWYDYYGYGGNQLEYYTDYDNLYDILVYDSVDNPSWINESYKTIYITGGTDVTSQGLISFLLSNATLVEDAPAENLDLFDQIYDILNQYLFEGQITQDDMSYKNLMLIVGSSVLSFFIVAIPFIAVFAVLKLFF